MLALPSISIKVKMPFWWEPQPARSRCRFDGNHNQRGSLQRGSLLRPESRFQIFFGKPFGPMGFRGSTSWLPLWSELFILPKLIFSKWLKFVLSNGFDNLSGCHTYLVIRFRENAPITCICHTLHPSQIADFTRISKTKTPSPIPETGSYDPCICSPF